MANIKCALQMQTMVYDRIEFIRLGLKNNNEVKFSLQVQVGSNEDGDYKVTLILKGTKKDEYQFEISLSGFFSIDNAEALNDKQAQSLINKNAVAILMPYLRSEVTLLTAQPNMDSIVLPPFNINRMLDAGSDK